MTLNEVLWRQICSVKAKSDELVFSITHLPDAKSVQSDIATQTAIIVCYASYATGDVSPMQVYDDIIEQVSQLQNSIWSICKSCDDSVVFEKAHKLYEACATLKKRLKKRLCAIEQTESLTSQTKQIVLNALEKTSHNPTVYA